MDTFETKDWQAALDVRLLRRLQRHAQPGLITPVVGQAILWRLERMRGQSALLDRLWRRGNIGEDPAAPQAPIVHAQPPQPRATAAHEQSARMPVVQAHRSETNHVLNLTVQLQPAAEAHRPIVAPLAMTMPDAAPPPGTAMPPPAAPPAESLVQQMTINAAPGQVVLPVARRRRDTRSMPAGSLPLVPPELLHPMPGSAGGSPAGGQTAPEERAADASSAQQAIAAVPVVRAVPPGAAVTGTLPVAAATPPLVFATAPILPGAGPLPAPVPVAAGVAPQPPALVFARPAVLPAAPQIGAAPLPPVAAETAPPSFAPSPVPAPGVPAPPAVGTLPVAAPPHIDVDELVERTLRRLRRQMAIEKERQGARRWR
jgi:hypothetical protein